MTTGIGETKPKRSSQRSTGTAKAETPPEHQRRPGAPAPEGVPLPHLVVQDVRPATPHGYPAKAIVGERIPVRANIFRDGHDVLAARAVLRRGKDVAGTSALVNMGNDEWEGAVVAHEPGYHELVVEAWTDRYATWAKRAEIKRAAYQDIATEIAEGRELLSEWLARPVSPDGPSPDGPSPDGPSPDGGRGHAVVDRALAALRDRGGLDLALSARVADALSGPALARDLTAALPAPIWVEREAAGVGAWYELFPRSFGGLQGAASQVERVARLGFDVLYLPPVHPIGHTARKGKNNSTEAAAGDPGSPWAIGSEEGGHTSVHPDLGTLEDFDHLVRTAAEHGMEVALDYALNCTPDHPWVREHPEWFHHRPDGSIAYAENPPKKYQDIYPLNFWPADEADRVALWRACKEIIDFWAGRGVRIFRVDNPHTKPFPFWEWLIGELRSEWPDVVLLAEAFTRPKVMARLAEVGFSQSYTYFTWRVSQHGPEGIRTYMEELAHGPLADYMRPNFWPSTPDILSGPLRRGPAAAFALRYVLAATLTPLYGVYSGYELYENEPVSPDNEEYLGSEKYEIKHRDFSQPGSLGPLMSAVNAIRRRHPAFARLRTVRFHGSDNPNVMAYSKSSDDGSDTVLVVVTLDPHSVQDSTLHLDMGALGRPPGSPLEVQDELSGEIFAWGPHPYVRFDPLSRVAHILDVRRDG